MRQDSTVLLQQHHHVGLPPRDLSPVLATLSWKTPPGKDRAIGVRQREELTGAFALPANVKFFDQAFIECGAVVWPGKVDLAPDTMYAAIASQQGLEHHPPGPANAHR